MNPPNPHHLSLVLFLLLLLHHTLQGNLVLVPLIRRPFHLQRSLRIILQRFLVAILAVNLLWLLQLLLRSVRALFPQLPHRNYQLRGLLLILHRNLVHRPVKDHLPFPRDPLVLLPQVNLPLTLPPSLPLSPHLLLLILVFNPPLNILESPLGDPL